MLGGLLMKGKRIFSAVIITSIIICFLFSSVVIGDTTSSISIELDKTMVRVGDIIKASIKINNINNFMGYQIYIKYDPAVLQPVTVGTNNAYKVTTFLENATILKNDSFFPFKTAQNDLTSGILNFSCFYSERVSYKNNGNPEKTGVLGEVGFKVLKGENTQIRFQTPVAVSGAITGTKLYDWDLSQITSGYSVIQPAEIIADTSGSSSDKSNIYQAENASLSFAKIDTRYSGYTGEGYVDYNNWLGAYIEWEVNASQAGNTGITIRYANGTSNDLSMNIDVNGQNAISALSFNGTGAWTNWETKKINVDLKAGKNIIRVSANTSYGGPNIDYLEVGTVSNANPTASSTHTSTPTRQSTPTPTPTKAVSTAPASTPTSTPTAIKTNTPVPNTSPTMLNTTTPTIKNTPVGATFTPVNTPTPTVAATMQSTPTTTPTATPSATGLKVIVGSIEGIAGDIVIVPIRFENVPKGAPQDNNSYGINNTDFALHYDKDVLEVVEVYSGEITVNPASNFSHHNNSANGTVTLLYSDDTATGSEAIKTDGIFARVRFRIKYNAKLGFSEIRTEIGSFDDPDLKNIPATSFNGGVNVISLATNTPTPAATPTGSPIITPTILPNVTLTPTPTPTPTLLATTTPTITPTSIPSGFTISVDNVQAWRGNVLSLPLRFTRVPSGGINNCDFHIQYNPSIVQIESVSPGEIVVNPSVNFACDIKPGSSKVVFLYSDGTGTDREQIRNDGVFAYLNIKVSDTAPLGLSSVSFIPNTITFADYYLQTIRIDAIIDGGVTVADASLQTDTGMQATTPGVFATPDQSQIVYTTSIPSSNYDGEHRAYMQGYPDGTFRPGKNITRAEAAVIFANLLGFNSNSPAVGNSFSDLKENHWAAWAIKNVSNAGLFNGYKDGTFMPDKNITRGEFTTVVFKYLGIQLTNITEYKFKDTNNHWAGNYIEEMSRLRYINGYSDGTFRPNANITRAECVAMINRALNRGPLYRAGSIFPDVDEKHWAYMDIAEAVLNHRYKIDRSGQEVIIKE